MHSRFIGFVENGATASELIDLYVLSADLVENDCSLIDAVSQVSPFSQLACD